MSDKKQAALIEAAAKLTAAWLSNDQNRIVADEVPAFLSSMHQTLRSLSEEEGEGGGTETAGAQQHAPAVSVRKSLASRDHLISLIDGKPYRSLSRHLTQHGLTPAQYRERFGLKPAYPMVAPGYSEARRELAKKIGLGSKGRRAQASSKDEVPAGSARKQGSRARTRAKKPV